MPEAEAGMVCLVVGLGGALLLLLGVALNYNGLVRTRNHVRDSWAGIDTELKRRYDLIPNLVETVKGYARHEREVLDARDRGPLAGGRLDGFAAREQALDENVLVGALRQIFALAEGYPQLKSDRNFLELQRELVNTEDRIQAARRFFNGNVREYNNRCQMFPSSLIAGMFSFRVQEYFEVEATGVRAPVAVDFDRPSPP